MIHILFVIVTIFDELCFVSVLLTSVLFICGEMGISMNREKAEVVLKIFVLKGFVLNVKKRVFVRSFLVKTCQKLAFLSRFRRKIYFSAV